MKQIVVWILIGFAAGLALALPARFWIVVAIAAAALVFVVGIWAVVMIIKGAVRAARGESAEPWRTD